MATIRGPGMLKTDCSQQVWPITPEILRSSNSSWGEWKTEEVWFGTPSTRLSGFEVQVTPIFTYESSAALMRVGLTSWFDL